MYTFKIKLFQTQRTTQFLPKSFLKLLRDCKSRFGCFNRVVTRYMGSGITASGSGSWTRDPGSQVMGSGSAKFFWSWRGSRIDRFLDTLFFMRNKNIPFCKVKGLFSGLLKKFLTFIPQFFYVSVTQSAV